MEIARAFVYFNLHKRVFSVRNRKTGRVVSHANTVWVEGAEFRVQEGGRQRVLQERRKNVHAGVCGAVSRLSEKLVVDPPGGVEITYNPYDYDSFVTLADKIPVHNADKVVLSGKRVWAWGCRGKIGG